MHHIQLATVLEDLEPAATYACAGVLRATHTHEHTQFTKWAVPFIPISKHVNIVNELGVGLSTYNLYTHNYPGTRIMFFIALCTVAASCMLSGTGLWA